jgi:hypothetical protein
MVDPAACDSVGHDEAPLRRRTRDRVARARNVAPAAFSEKLNNLDGYVRDYRTLAEFRSFARRVAQVERRASAKDHDRRRGTRRCARHRHHADGNGEITKQRLRRLARAPGVVAQQTLEIRFLDPSGQAHAFTFG